MTVTGDIMTINEMDLTGQRFTRLVALEQAGFNHRNEILWKCKCDCGGLTTVVGGYLLSTNTKSCGCYHKIRTRSLFKKPLEFTGAGKVLSSYRKRARESGRVFELDRDYFTDLIQHNCYYCGAVPGNRWKVHETEFIYQGVDRIDNAEGYTLDNCVPCCMICNKMKKAMSSKEFLDHIGRIHENCNVIE